ncbi:MAG: hypothetical protein WCR67_08055 [Bacilli bacterium]
MRSEGKFYSETDSFSINSKEKNILKTSVISSNDYNLKACFMTENYSSFSNQKYINNSKYTFVNLPGEDADTNRYLSSADSGMTIYLYKMMGFNSNSLISSLNIDITVTCGVGTNTFLDDVQTRDYNKSYSVSL